MSSPGSARIREPQRRPGGAAPWCRRRAGPVLDRGRFSDMICTSAGLSFGMPFYSDSLLDEVRNSVNIVSVVSEYVALKRRGRNHVARCPFHVEKTPSFNVNEERQIFMCFGCGVGGDVFKFLMQMEHITFPEAVRLLAERQGIALPKAAAGDAPVAGAESGTLRDAMLEAARLYHRALVDSAEGRGPLEYLLGRGLVRETIDLFSLGYSPAGGAFLLEALRRKGYEPAAPLECGLVKTSEDGRMYDAFRGRIMFPIRDIQGRIVAFGGRALGERQPKYLNSPEGKLYHKGHHLFGLSHSREDIKREGFAVLVEGYLDFIIPYQHGAKNLVASLGTSLTPQQVRLLGRYTRDVVVSYDPDSAGQAAAQRSLDLFLEEDFRVRVFRLPQGQDPDAFVRSTGVEEYRARLRESPSYLDFVLETAIGNQGGLRSPKSKVQA
ncbi:MAG: DNA primase, partial [Acidobacteria bacterium]|nr:DNA primase [Acidobacteriota bacterium]